MIEVLQTRAEKHGQKFVELQVPQRVLSFSKRGIGPC